MPFKATLSEKKSLPPDTRVYAIGDIHGRSDLLQEKFNAIDDHLQKWPIENPIEILLGDYIDRGHDSKGVIDAIIARGERRNLVALAGNHEQMLLEFLEDHRKLGNWLAAGGKECLMSYGILAGEASEPAAQLGLLNELKQKIPPRHVSFLKQLKCYFISGDYLFVHAGIRPGAPIGQQNIQDLLWIRRNFLDCQDDFGCRVVHGHTPVQTPEFYPNRVNIDTGAYITGRLTCLILEGKSHLLMAN